MRIKFAIASFEHESQMNFMYDLLQKSQNKLVEKYKNKKGITKVISLFLEKHNGIWYGRALELPQAYTRSYFYWFCVLKLKIMSMVDLYRAY